MEAQLIARHIRQARRQREAEQQQRQQQAADYARHLWRDARCADSDPPYLIAKGVRGHALRQRGDALLVPLIHDGALVSLQCIRPDGRKRFLPGGKVNGCYSLLGHIAAGELLYICEGWATGATIHESTDAAVACAMTASNLAAVGEHLHHRYPDAVLIVADEDRQTPGNPGRTSAMAVALVAGAFVRQYGGSHA
ncbi:DNA primase TraC [compost metagenome]